MSKTIFLDMDGVLVDWVGSVLRKFNRELIDSEVQWDLGAQLGLEPNFFWSQQDYNFWRYLDWTPEGQELLAGLERGPGTEGVSIALLSSPCKTQGCQDGKRAWVMWKMPSYSRRLFLGNDKHLVAGPGKVLVDDHDENIVRWWDHGGVGVLVPRPWNARRAQTDDRGRFDVRQLLAEINWALNDGPPGPVDYQTMPPVADPMMRYE